MKKLLVITAIVLVSFLLVRCGVNRNPNAKKNALESIEDTAVYNKYLKRGGELAIQTGTELIKNVSEAIAKEGTEYAISYCNTKALPLTDSMATLLNVSIKRVTDKARNPANLANGEELSYIELAKSELASGKKPKPWVVQTAQTMEGYYPILTTNMCMQCHGNKDAIDVKTLTKLKQLYPADSATGYKPDQLRGLWVIQMNKESMSQQPAL